MYWSDWGIEARIERASMDGSGRMVIHNTSLIWPNALTLDIPTQTLYWADGNLDKVESSGVDGSNRRLITQDGVSHPFAIAIKDASVYFTDWTLNSIRRVSNIGGSAMIIKRLVSCARPFGVQVVDPSKQLLGKHFIIIGQLSTVTPLIDEFLFVYLVANPCDHGNGGCSHLCLLSTASAGFTCACPDGMTLQGSSNCIQSN